MCPLYSDKSGGPSWCKHFQECKRIWQIQTQLLFFSAKTQEPKPRWLKAAQFGTTTVSNVKGNNACLSFLIFPTCENFPAYWWICPCQCSCALGHVCRCSPASCSLRSSRKSTPSCTGYNRKNNFSLKDIIIGLYVNVKCFKASFKIRRSEMTEFLFNSQ